MKTTDGQLLAQIETPNQHTAFEELMRRHGAMVMGVCRRIVGNHQDAQDAFQATFLVLIQKYRSMKTWENIGGWLYQVACRTSRKSGRKLRR